MQQALGSSDIATSLVAKIGCQLRSAFLKGLQDVSNKECVRATTPLKLGGMVLRYPEVAGLMKAAEFALDLGADTQCVQEERTEHVKIPYSFSFWQVGSTFSSSSLPSKELQGQGWQGLNL